MTCGAGGARGGWAGWGGERRRGKRRVGVAHAMWGRCFGSRGERVDADVMLHCLVHLAYTFDRL